MKTFREKKIDKNRPHLVIFWCPKPRKSKRKGGFLPYWDYITMKTKVQEGKFKGAWFKVRKEGNYAEAVSMEKLGRPAIKRLSKNYYMVLSTGEVKQYKLGTSKSVRSLQMTMQRLRGLIRCNFKSGAQNQCFLTLTYAENMTDTKRLMSDWDKFYKRLKYAYKGAKFEYLAVAEPQERGAWHLHVLLRDDKRKRLWIKAEKLTEIWGHGMTQIERIKCDDVGEYFITYFTCVQSHRWDIGEEKGARTHAQKKADRLHLYPSGFNFYRASRGLKRPEKIECKTEELNNEFPLLIKDKSYNIIDADTGEILNRIERQTRKVKSAQNLETSAQN